MPLETSTRTRTTLVHLHRAAFIADLADRVSNRVLPAASDLGPGPAITLYREAAHWALAAHQMEPPSGASQAMTSVEPRTLVLAAGDETTLACAREALQQTFTDTAELSEEEQVRQLRALRRLVRGLIDSASPTNGRMTLRRWVGAVLAIGALLAGAGTWRWMAHRDLAANRPWRASSIEAGCDMQLRFCGGQVVDVFFHTKDEDSPWVEIDLGSIETISTITVTNRKDCCKERAVPMVLEISMDQSTFTEVARRDDTFTEWKAKFDPVRTRYVRARSLRRTILHLEQIAVR